MKRFGAFVFCAMLCPLLACCALMNRHHPTVEPEAAGTKDIRSGLLREVDLSGYGVNTFLGVSGIYDSQEKMKHAALFDCLKYDLICAGINADTYGYYESRNAEQALQSVDIYGYDDTHFYENIDSLEIVGTWLNENDGAVVLARDKSLPSSVPLHVTVYDSDGKPDWIKHTPVIDGYWVGIGKGKRFSTMNKALESARYWAMTDLLVQVAGIELNVGGTEEYASVNGLQGQLKQALSQSGGGHIVGFKALDFWYDGKDDIVWCLAVIPRK
jgi:hypothetical protein